MAWLAKEHRSAALIIAIVLVIVSAWWLVFVPRTKTYKNYRREAQLKEMMRRIGLPEKSKLLNMDIEKSPVVRAMGTYWTDSSCDAVNAYYKEQFTKQGFMGIQNEGTQGGSLSFSSPDFYASLNCAQPQGSHTIYLISMNWKTAL